MSSPEPTGLGPPQVYDPDGDLRLIIGSEDPLSLIVCSKTLARASKFFKPLLYGGFEESKSADPNQGWVVSLPEPEVDDRALDIVMNILHGNIHKVPDKILFCEGIKEGGLDARKEAACIVRDIATVADYWSVTHVLRPWANSWLNDSCRGYRYHRWHGSLIQAAWHLGDEVLLASQLGLLVREIVSGAGEDYIDWNAGCNDPPHVRDYELGGYWELKTPRKGLGIFR